MKEHLDNLSENNSKPAEDITSDTASYIENLLLSCYLKDFKFETEEDLLFFLMLS